GRDPAHRKRRGANVPLTVVYFPAGRRPAHATARARKAVAPATAPRRARRRELRPGPRLGRADLAGPLSPWGQRVRLSAQRGDCNHFAEKLVLDAASAPSTCVPKRKTRLRPMEGGNTRLVRAK